MPVNTVTLRRHPNIILDIRRAFYFICCGGGERGFCKFLPWMIYRRWMIIQSSTAALGRWDDHPREVRKACQTGTQNRLRITQIPTIDHVKHLLIYTMLSIKDDILYPLLQLIMPFPLHLYHHVLKFVQAKFKLV